MIFLLIQGIGMMRGWLLWTVFLVAVESWSVVVVPHRAPGRRAGLGRSIGASVQTTADTAVIDELLELTSPGPDVPYTPEDLKKIKSLITTVEASSSPEESQVLSDPLLTLCLAGSWKIRFVQDAEGSQGSPVGGPFRYSRIGRLVFPTVESFQIISSEKCEVVNHLCFKLLSFIPGSVTLQGSFQKVEAQQPVLLGLAHHIHSSLITDHWQYPPNPAARPPTYRPQTKTSTTLSRPGPDAEELHRRI